MLYRNETYDEERALYGVRGAVIEDCTFAGPADGESALKESRDIQVKDCLFELRYPFWHVTGAKIENARLTETCRAAMWYDRDMEIRNSKLHGIKALRECRGVKIEGSDVISAEFGWKTRGVSIRNSSLEGEYPFLMAEDVEISGLKMKGKYSFQYVKNMVIRDSVLDTKDAFWHAENVTVYDSVVKGEYLAWYSKSLRLVRCKIIGTQPLCYCENLILEDCTMEGTDLAFEYSDVEATVKGNILSVKNPGDGFIRADSIGEIILDENRNREKHCEITQG